MSEEPKGPEQLDSEQLDDENDDYEPSKFDRAIDYIETERGHEIAVRLVSSLELFAPAIRDLLEAKIRNQLAQPKVDLRKWSLLLAARVVVFLAAITALLYMRRSGIVDPAILVLIGSLVAYFFGYNKSQP